MLVLQISALLPMWGGFFCTSAGVKPVLLATTDLALLLIMVCSGNASRCSSSTVTACATLQRDKHRQCMKWGIQKHLWMGRGIKFFLKKRIMRTWIVPASPLRGCASMHFEAFMAPIAQYTVRIQLFMHICTRKWGMYLYVHIWGRGLGLSQRWSSTSSVHYQYPVCTNEGPKGLQHIFLRVP